MSRTLRNEVLSTWRSGAPRLLLAVGLAVAGTSAADAALTTPSCLAKKLKEWGKLRNDAYILEHDHHDSVRVMAGQARSVRAGRAQCSWHARMYLPARP